MEKILTYFSIFIDIVGSFPPIENLSESEKIAFTIGYGFMILVGLPGNFLIMVVIATYKELRNDLNMLLFNMVFADIIRMLLTTSLELFIIHEIGNALSPIYVDSGLSGRVFCKSMFGFPPMLSIVVVFTLVVMTCERFLAVVFPFHVTLLKNKSKWIVTAIWFVAAVLAAPIFSGATLGELPSGGHICLYDYSLLCNGNIIKDRKCNFRVLKQITSVLVYLTFVVAFLLILLLHVVMAVRLHRRRRGFNERDETYVSNSLRNSTRDVVRMLGVASFVYVITSLPSQMYQFGFIYNTSWLNKAMPPYFNFLLMFISSSHSMIYPWIYPLFVRRFREKYSLLFYQRILKRVRSQSETSTSARQTLTTMDNNKNSQTETQF